MSFSLDENKYWFEVEPLLLGQGRIIETDGLFLNRSWHYDDVFKACLALIDFTTDLSTDELEGWVRAFNPDPDGPSFRRRPDGTPESEFLAD